MAFTIDYSRPGLEVEEKSAGMVLASLFPSLGIGCNAICTQNSRKSQLEGKGAKFA